MSPTAPFEEIGRSGMTKYGGRVYGEFLRELSGRQGMSVFREMRDNDPTIGAIAYAIEMLIRGVDWWIEPAKPEPEYEDAAKFVDECRGDMSDTWEETIIEVLTMLWYGWSYHEIVYKRRLGIDAPDSSSRSKYTDGRIGWRKFPIRAQETLDKWQFDEDDDGILGMWQRVQNDSNARFIPLEKALLFRTTPNRRSPEGRSILRNAYRPWYFKKRMEEIEGIGIERELAGLPVITPPEDVDINDVDDPDAQIARRSAQDLVNNIRRDSAEGIVKPFGWELELLSTGGRRQIDVGSVIERYDRRAAMTMLGDVILIGHEQVGSYALTESKTNLLAMSVGAILDLIAAVFDRYAIPRLMSYNVGFPTDEHPRLKHSDLETVDLGALADFITKMVASGVLQPDETIENYIRVQANLPTKPDDQDTATDDQDDGDEVEVVPADDGMPEGDDDDDTADDALMERIAREAQAIRKNGVMKGLIVKASRHGASIKCPDIYEALRREGKTKRAAARISNAMRQKGHACH